MNVEMVTCVMIHNPLTNEVLIQNRKRKHPGWSFPGGHVELAESIYDCAIREVLEETGLVVRNLKLHGVIHWVNRISDDRYLCFMFSTFDFSGVLTTENDEGEYFWLHIDALLSTPKDMFSSIHYALSPLFHENGKYCETFIQWSGDESSWSLFYK